MQLRLLSPPITKLSCCSLPRIRSRTPTQSASLQPPVSVCKHRRFALLKRSYKANQPGRNSRQLVVRLILTLVRFASLSVRTDLGGPLVASLPVENTQQTLLDIKLTSKWFGLPRTTLCLIESLYATRGRSTARACPIIRHLYALKQLSPKSSILLIFLVQIKTVHHEDFIDTIAIEGRNKNPYDQQITATSLQDHKDKLTLFPYLTSRWSYQHKYFAWK